MGIYTMEDFFRNPALAGCSVSPGGEHVAFLQPWNDRMNVHVARAGGPAVRVTQARDRDILEYHWANDDRLVYLRDRDGDENYQLWAVDADGCNDLLLTPQVGVSASVIDLLAGCDHEVLVALNATNARHHDVYRLDTYTGAQRLVAANPGNVTSWLTDHDGQVRAAVATDGVNATLLLCNGGAAPFRAVLTTSFRERVTPLLFSPDNRHLYAASNLGRDKAAIVRMDMAGRELEVVFEHPEVDAATLIYSRKEKKLMGVTFTTWKRQYHFLDEGRRDLQARLEAMFPGYEVQVVSASEDERRLIVHAASERTMGTYYLYREESRDAVTLGEASPWLREEDLAETRPIAYPARDGLIIHGYLTVPPGRKTGQLPVVVNPHGGPWFRDVWGYNKEVQFFASRGYATLQMNFRGSLGYGRAFWESGFGEWGRAMQDDVSDGVEWLIGQGIADPRRIAIYGSSYGGYAALAGLAFTPDLYACGIDYVGISNLLTFMNTIPPYFEPYLAMMHEMVGDPVRDQEALASVSPVFHVEKIRAPLLIVQGAMDPRVNRAESDQLVEALRARGIQVPYIVKEDEGHGFQKEENRFEFFRAMEAFLAAHLGPGRS